jgi:hypothetical protein
MTMVGIKRARNIESLLMEVFREGVKGGLVEVRSTGMVLF